MIKKSIFIIATIFTMLVFAKPVFAEENEILLEISCDKGGFGEYAIDAEDNQLGISDFCVSGDIVWVLSNVHNTLRAYKNGEITAELDFSDMGYTVLGFAADGDTVYVYNNLMELIRFDKGIETARMSMYEFVNSEAVNDFYMADGNLYIVMNDAKIRDYVTYEIHAYDDSSAVYSDSETNFQHKTLKVVSKTKGRRVYDGEIEDLEADTDMLDEAGEKTAEAEGYIFVCREGMMKLTDIADGGCYYYCSEILKSDREYQVKRIYRFDAAGKLCAAYTIPEMKETCCFPFKVCSGQVYLMITDADEIRIGLIQNLTDSISDGALTPVNWSTVWNTDEAETDNNAQLPLLTATASVSRASCLSRAASYYTSFTWSCSAANLTALTNWSCPRYVTGAGSYNSMPYCYGGFSTISDFNTGIRSGLHVGNINTSCSLDGQTVGLDCSGYISRIWARSTPLTTSTLSSVCSVVAWNNIQTGDAMNKSGSHVMMYYYGTSSGLYCVYECTTTGNVDRVVLSNRSRTGYTPYKYNYIS